jgi:hypothetical protein
VLVKELHIASTGEKQTHNMFNSLHIKAPSLRQKRLRI